METEMIETKKSLLDEVLNEKPSDILFGELKTELQKQTVVDKNNTLVIVLLFKNENFKGITKSYNIEIYGKKMFEWVSSACDGYEVKTVTCDKSSNIVTLVKPFLNEKENVLVLYSDTPLITQETIDQTVDYFSFSKMNVLRLPRGWMFKTEYIKIADSVSSITTREFNKEEFEIVNQLSQIENISKILKSRIFAKHYENGVLITDYDTTFIGPDVIIGSGTKIEPNNVLRGMTFIGKNCVLEPFNTITDSIISNNCFIKNSTIIKSKISDNMVVGPFEIIENKLA